MGTVQVVLGRELLKAADRVARRRGVNRSALLREALRAYLEKLATQDRENRDRAGYDGHPIEPGRVRCMG